MLILPALRGRSALLPIADTLPVSSIRTVWKSASGIDAADQPSLFGLAQVLQASGKLAEADALYRKTVAIDGTSHVADRARIELRALAATSFRMGWSGGVQPDAVMYCLGALRTFGEMKLAEVQKIGFEIGVIGQKGLDTSDPMQKYQLKSLPGKFSGLHLICLMYVAFKIVAPSQDMGFDLKKEYEVAKAIHKEKPV